MVSLLIKTSWAAVVEKSCCRCRSQCLRQNEDRPARSRASQRGAEVAAVVEKWLVGRHFLLDCVGALVSVSDWPAMNIQPPPPRPHHDHEKRRYPSPRTTWQRVCAVPAEILRCYVPPRLCIDCRHSAGASLTWERWPMASSRCSSSIAGLATSATRNSYRSPQQHPVLAGREHRGSRVIVVHRRLRLPPAGLSDRDKHHVPARHHRHHPGAAAAATDSKRLVSVAGQKRACR
jgi:hypothetical protein